MPMEALHLHNKHIHVIELYDIFVEETSLPNIKNMHKYTNACICTNVSKLDAVTLLHVLKQPCCL